MRKKIKIKNPEKEMFFAHPTLPFSLLLLLGGVVIKADELRITTAQELIDFSNDVSNRPSFNGTTVYLDSDIEFTPSLSQQFEPIGNTSSYYFKGTFDGQGHRISNLVMNLSLTYVGLFGYSYGAIIKNVILDGSCSFIQSSENNNPTIGSIYGYCSSCTFESIVNMASVTYIGSATTNFCVSGIVGRLLGSSTIRNCVNYGSVINSGTSTTESDIGGITGFCGGEGTKFIQNCANYGTITNNGESNSLYLGGIAGQSYCGTIVIENCVSGGRIVNSKQANGNNYIGSVAGYIPSKNNPQTIITHCFWTSDVGYDSVYGYNETTMTVTDSSLRELTKETVDELNEYAGKNSTWNKWLLNTNNSTIHFKVNDYNGFNTSNKLILFPDLAGTGNNSFKGWFTDPGYSTPHPSYEVSEGMTLYGLYGVVVTVTFDGNGGTPSQQSKSVMFNKTYGALPGVGERSGYSFARWFTSKEERKGERVTEEDIVDIGSDHTLYAQWSINNYTITFIFNNTKENEMKTLNFNDTIAYPENLTREGFIFNGWSPKPDTMPAENITVTAQWIEVTPELVEIVFEKKDLREEEIKEIIKEYTQEEFTIERIETDENTGEIKVIIKFVDEGRAQSFIDKIELSSGTKDIIKKVGPIHEPQGNSSTLFNPNVLFYSLL